MLNNPRNIGRVRHVSGATVTVELDSRLAGVTPLWEGRLHPIGQVGSLVQIPQGPTKLLAIVTLVGIAELSGVPAPSAAVQVGDRWLQTQLIGEIDGLGKFRRGVAIFPSLDDPVQFTTATELASVFPEPNTENVMLGYLTSAPDVPIALLAQPLVVRHAAIVGSTGSGKTSAVATLIQNFANGGWTSANIIVVDPHGEYTSALSTVASVRSVLGLDQTLLRIPYWSLPASDIVRIFCGAVESATFNNRFNELVANARRDFANRAIWLKDKIDLTAITADTPIPFDIRDVWFQMDEENNAVFEKMKGEGNRLIEAPGNAKELKSTKFKPYSPGGPFKGPSHGYYGNHMAQMRLRLLDPRFRFLLEAEGKIDGEDPLVNVIQEWLGDLKPVSVLDFSGVPSEVTDIAIGVVLQLLLELALRSTTQGIGRPRPVLIVLEEAHRYLGCATTTRMACEATNRIAREGRKYGIGLLLVTQRPSELPDTALSQVGTVMALRLTNGADQSRVKAALPDAVAGLAEALPALRTGEAIVTGEAVALPSRIKINPPSPWPRASDPTLETWRNAPSLNNVSEAIKKWRTLSYGEEK